jgi:hypothetical protein
MKSTTEFPPCGIALHDLDDPVERHERALPNGEQRDSPSLIASGLRFPAVACAGYDVGRPPRSKQIATFLCGRHFLRVFSSRHDVVAADVVDNGFAFPARPKYGLRGLPEAFLIVAGNEARTLRSAARMPFASPYCLCLAQIRRLHVQPRTRLAVHPSMRVRESCLTFSPRASPHDSQNPWWSFYFVRPLSKRFE